MSQLLDATSIILMKPSGEVFWVQRSKNLPFMPGFYAFPGGKVDVHDSDADLLSWVKQTPQTSIYDPRFVVCAFRELFEETGVLPTEQTLSFEMLNFLRKQLLDQTCSFSDVVKQLRLTLSPERLVYLGHRITPPFSPKRFYAHFFLTFLPQGQKAEVWPGELSKGEWIDPKEAIELWRDGKVLIAPPTLSALELLDRHGGTQGLVKHFAHPEMPTPRIEIRPGIFMLPLETPTLPPATHTNCFIIGHKELVVIDPGSPYEEEQAKLDQFIDHFASQGRYVKEILLTHFHVDHVGGSNHLRDRLNVPVVAHPQTVDRLTGDVKVDRVLEGKHADCIDLGRDPVTKRDWRLQAIHTPGHTQGHLCFLDERFGTLLAGDMLAGIGTVIIDPPEGDMADYLNSLKKLQRIALDLIFPAHGAMITSPQEKLQEYLDHRQMRENRILERLRQGQASIEDLLPIVYTDILPHLFPLATRSLLAHLEKLIREKRIDQEQGYYLLLS